MKYQISN